MAGAGGGLFPLELHDDNPPSDPLFGSDEEPSEVRLMPQHRVFFLVGLGVPHLAKILSISPHWYLSLFLDQGLFPPAEVRPQKFEKFKYIFVSNLTLISIYA